MGNDSISILIKSLLQSPTDADINKLKLDLERKLNNINIKANGKGVKILDDKEIELYAQKMQNMLSRLQIGKTKVFENAGVQEELNKFTQSLELFKTKSGISAKEVGLQFDNLKTKVAQVSNEFKNVSHDGYAFADMLTLAAKKLVIWKLAGDAVFAVIGLLKQIPDIVSQIDTSLTEINKVLDLSTSKMKQLAEEATKMGIAYGKTTVEVLNSVGAFAKAGLDQETAQRFAELAMLLSNVGNISTEVAEQTLIMANAGYQLGNDYKTLNALISQFNELANRNAVEVDTLSQAWQVSASIAKQAKLDIADYNAIITVAGSTSQRSGKEVGNALRTWFMRLQGVTDGVDTLEEDVSKVDKVLGDLGIQLKKSPTEFRPAMDVITEIAAKYQELGRAGETVKQSELLEVLAGKYRANIVAGVLQNFNQINKAINDQANSYQSAEKENARYMDSIQARTKALSAQWELFATKTLDSTVIKSIVELGRAIIQILDSGLVRFISTAALLTATIYGLGAAFKSLGLVSVFGAIGNALVLMTSGTVGFQVAIGLLTAKLKILTTAMLASPLFWVAAGSLAITGIITAIKTLSEEYEKQVEHLRNLNTEYETLTTTLKDVEDQLKNVVDRINELQGKDKLTLSENEELERLKEINKQLENQLINQQALIDIKNKEREQQAIDILNARKNKNPDAKISYTASPLGGTMLTSTESTEVDDIEYLQKQLRIYDEYEKKIRALTGSEKNYAEVLADLTAKRDESYNVIATTLSAVEETAKALNNLTPEGTALKNIITGIRDAFAGINKDRGIIANISQEFGNVGNSAGKAETKVKDYTTAIEDSKKAIESFESSAKNLSSIMQDINDGESISAENLLGLIEKYPEYTTEILKANKSRETALELTNKLWEVERNRAIQAKLAEADILEGRLANLRTLVATVPLSEYSQYIGNGVELSQFQEIIKTQKLLTDAQATIDALRNWKPSDFSGKSSSSSKSKPDSPFTKAYEQLSFERSMDIINAKQYYDKLTALYKQYESSLGLDEQRKIKIELHNLEMDFIEEENRAREKKIEDDRKLVEEQTNAIQDAIDRMTKIRKAFYQDQLDDEDDRHKKAVENLDDELDEYEKFINSKIKALDELYAKQDYERQLSEFDSQASKIQAQINAIALDDSDEAKARRAQLEDELGKITQDKSDAVRDHTRESEKDMYEDLLDLKKENIENLKDLEDDRYEKTKESIEKLMDDYAIQCQVEKDLTNSTTMEIVTMYENMGKKIGGVYDSLIEKVKFFNSIAAAKPLVNDKGGAGVGFQQSRHEYGMSDEDYYKLLANGQKWAELNRQGLNNNNSAEARALHEENERLRKRYGIPTGVYPKYLNGGAVTESGFVFVDGSKQNPEYFLKSIDFKMLRDTVDIVRNMIPKISTPNFQNIKAGNPITNYFNFSVPQSPNQNPEDIAKVCYKYFNDQMTKNWALKGI